MTCREASAFLDDYLSGELPWAVREGFEAHLADCRSCLAYLAQYRDAIRLARTAMRESDAEIPAELVNAILAARARGQP